MRVAAVDSAETSGLCVLERGPAGERVLFHGTAKILTAADVVAAAELLVVHSPTLIVVEEPFCHPKFPLTGYTLSRLCGRWQQQFEVAGFAVVTVPAALWQRKVLPGFNPRMRSAERKVAAQALARQLFGLEVGEDTADAIGLAVYTARNTTIGAAA